MGGGAFAVAHAEGQPTLRTPRMDSETYFSLKRILLKKVQDLFPNGKVVPLTEAPGKEDYGDIDIFVALDQHVDFMALADHIGAAGVICHDSTKATFAVGRDGTASVSPCVLYKDSHTHNPLGNSETPPPVSAEEFAQIDIAVVPRERLDWYTFYSSYSDLAGLLGHIVTQLGFTVSDRGLWLRLPELDFSKTVHYVNVADRDGMILLSSDPKQVIEHLGCSADLYERGFQSLDELYSWLGACRLLSPDALKTKRNNAHERNREQTRTVYSGFFNDWLPAHMNMESASDEKDRAETVKHLREQYLQEALQFFSKRHEYEMKHSNIVLAIENGLAADLLKPVIAERSGRRDKHLNEILRAFRRYVGFKNSQPVVLSKPHTDAESELNNLLNDDRKSLRDSAMVNEWVEDHWEELRMLERQRSKPGH